jgi:hypothetical protein
MTVTGALGLGRTKARMNDSLGGLDVLLVGLS